MKETIKVNVTYEYEIKFHNYKYFIESDKRLKSKKDIIDFLLNRIGMMQYDGKKYVALYESDNFDEKLNYMIELPVKKWEFENDCVEAYEKGFKKFLKKLLKKHIML
jgi:hypothetical protein